MFFPDLLFHVLSETVEDSHFIYLLLVGSVSHVGWWSCISLLIYSIGSCLNVLDIF